MKKCKHADTGSFEFFIVDIGFDKKLIKIMNGLILGVDDLGVLYIHIVAAVSYVQVKIIVKKRNCLFC